MIIDAALNITEDNKDAVIALLERLMLNQAITEYELKDLKEIINRYYNHS